MTSLRLVVRTARNRNWRSIPTPSQTLNPRPRVRSRDLLNPRLLYHRAFEHQFHSSASAIQVPNPNGSGRNLMFPAALAGLLGVGGIEVAYADAAEEPSSPAESPATESHVDLEEIAKKQRQKIEDLLKSKGIRRGSYPQFTVAVKGQKVSIKFQIPPACEASKLIANMASHLGLKVEEHGGGSDILLRAWHSCLATNANSPRKKEGNWK